MNLDTLTQSMARPVPLALGLAGGITGAALWQKHRILGWLAGSTIGTAAGLALTLTRTQRHVDPATVERIINRAAPGLRTFLVDPLKVQLDPGTPQPPTTTSLVIGGGAGLPEERVRVPLMPDASSTFFKV